MENNMVANSQNNESCTSCHRSGCSCGKSTGLLLVRVALGIVFLAHGLDKLMNMQGTISFFSSLGFPAMLAYFVAAVETLGGLSMILGVFTKYFGWLLSAVMLVAIVKVKMMKGFALPMAGKYELDLVLLLCALAVSFAGPGKYSVMKSHCGGMCEMGGKKSEEKKL